MSALPDPFVRLVLPWRDGDATDPRVALLVVLAVAALVAWSVAAAAPAFEAHVSGTTTVDNPSYPGDVLCENDAFDRKPSGCDEPKTVQRELAPHAATTASNLVLPFGLAVVFGWLLTAAVVWTLTGASRASGAFRDVLAESAWAFVPFLLPAAARPFYVESVASAADSPGTLDGVAAAVRSILVGFESEPLAVLSFVALAWSAYVLAGAALRTRAVAPGRAVAAAVGPAVLLGLLSAVGGAGLVLRGEAFGYALLFSLVGLPLFAAPRAVIELNKRVELIGFRNADSVEPEGWYVALHRLGGLGSACLGYVLVDGPALLV